MNKKRCAFVAAAVLAVCTVAFLCRNQSVSGVKGVNSHSQAPAVTSAVHGKSFQDYLMEAVNSVNNQQLDVTNIQEKLITSPDEVDVHDVTIAMSKARMSLNLAQTVIDRLVSGWNEITTTR